MVQAKTLDKYIARAPEFAVMTGADPKLVERILTTVKREIETNRRQPAPPPPEGGISIRAAERKYKIRSSTISGWVKDEHIPILKRGSKEIYISEELIARVAKEYKTLKGRGNRAIIKIIKDCTTLPA